MNQTIETPIPTSFIGVDCLIKKGDGEGQGNTLRAKCDLIEVVLTESSGTSDLPPTNSYQFYGFISDDFSACEPDGSISGICNNLAVDGDKYVASISEAEVYKCSYGKFEKLNVVDWFGNITSLSDNGLSFSNELFDSLDELIKAGELYQEGNDALNNIITVKYEYTHEEEKDILIITNTKESTLDSQTDYNILELDLNKLSLKQTTYTKTSEGLIKNESTEYLIYSCPDEESGMITVINLHGMNELITYDEEIDVNKSNCYKAFNILGFDVKNTYWNGLMYVNSILLCEVPIHNDYSDVLIKEQTFDSTDSNTYLYNFIDGVMNELPGKYIITQTDILKNENGLVKPSGLDSIYVCKSGLSTYSIVNNGNDTNLNVELYNSTTGTNLEDIVKTIYLYDDDVEIRYMIELVIEKSELSKYLLFKKLGSGQDTKYVLIGEYDYAIISEKPTYIEDCEVVFVYQKVESSEVKKIVINSVSLAKVEYDTKEYNKTIEDGVVKVRPVFNIKYSNVPGKYIDKSDVFTLSIPKDKHYKLHPLIKYFENSLISPKYVDMNGKYITVADKFNQNVITSPVYIRSQYINNNNGMNDFSIGKKINPNTEHILESINHKYIMLGNMCKIGSIDEIAISSNEIYTVPVSSKMLLSLEFS